MSMKNSSDTFGNRTHLTPVCIAVPQPKYKVIVKSYNTSHYNKQLTVEFKNIWALFLQMHVGEAKRHHPTRHVTWNNWKTVSNSAFNFLVLNKFIRWWEAFVQLLNIKKVCLGISGVNFSRKFLSFGHNYSEFDGF
jgi:hypothetical protein